MPRRFSRAVFAVSLLAGCASAPPAEPVTATAAPRAAPPSSSSSASSGPPVAPSTAPTPRAEADATPPPGWHVVARLEPGDAISDHRVDDGRRLVVAEGGGGCEPKAAIIDGARGAMLPGFAGLAAVIPSMKKGASCSVTGVSAASPTELVMSVSVADQCHVIAWKASTFTHLGAYAAEGGACGPITRYHGGALVVARHADASVVPTLRAFGTSERAPEVARYRGKSSQHCGSFLTTIWAMRAFDDGNVVLVGTPCGIPNVVTERTRLAGKRDLPTVSKLVIDHPSRVFIESSTEVHLLSAIADDGMTDATLRLHKGVWAATPVPAPALQPEAAPIPKAWSVDATLVARSPALLVVTPAKVKNGPPVVVADAPFGPPLDFRRAPAPP